MFQFTKQEVSILKERAAKDDSVVLWLKKQVKELIENEIVFPVETAATWSHYYFCPKHSMGLNFNIKDNKNHVCPVDGEVFKGEPYDGAWWCIRVSDYADGCYYLAVLYMITDEKAYLEKAKEILLQAAKYYPGYQVHGGIPYNNPGKILSQSISDASWIQMLAKGYDILSETLTWEECSYIKENLFRECAEFLMGQRTPQLHNHEVIINSAVAVLGIILEREDIIHFALEEKYGMVYQAQNAFLSDGAWFEISLHYHYYALSYFIEYEKFARYTKYKLDGRIDYSTMIKFPHKVLQPDYNIPPINDAVYHPGLPKEEGIYEFAYSLYKEPEMAFYLNKMYEGRGRNNIHAFLYGVERLPQENEIDLINYHNGNGSGLTAFRGNHGKYLLVKHNPFGGEHDHYDYLALSFLAYGNSVAPDLGTTGYGAKLHYDYYKNTGSHNTVVINEGNHPPATPKVIRYEQNDSSLLLDVEVKWDGTFQGIDSHTIVQWDEESYKNARMRRIIRWKEDYFIDIFAAGGPACNNIDWVLHVPGRLGLNGKYQEIEGEFSGRKPFKYLKNVKKVCSEGVLKTSWELDNCSFNLYSLCNGEGTVYYADGPDNPSVTDLSYMINRYTGKSALYVNVFEACNKNEPVIKSVVINTIENKVEVMVETDSDKIDRFEYII